MELHRPRLVPTVDWSWVEKVLVEEKRLLDMSAQDQDMGFER